MLGVPSHLRPIGPFPIGNGVNGAHHNDGGVEADCIKHHLGRFGVEVELLQSELERWTGDDAYDSLIYETRSLG